MEPTPDDRLTRASKGDPRALDELLVEHLPALHAFVRLRAGHAFGGRESCSDLVQSVCREVLADGGDFRFRGETAFKNWLFTAAANKVVDRFRFHHRERRDAKREVAGDALGDEPGLIELLATYRSVGTPSQVLQQREQVERIEAAFAELPEAQQQAIGLSRIAGMTYAEIAAETGRTEVAVRGLVARGLIKLAALLDR